MMLPQEIRIAATRYADSTLSQGIEDIRCAIISAYISGVMAHANLNTAVEIDTDNCSDAEASFMEFWNLYDKKRAKPECEKLWNKLTKAEKKKAMDYIPLYKDAQPDKQFRQDPQRFLRRKTWEDEIIKSNSNGPQRQNNNANEQELDFLSADLQRIACTYQKS